MKYEVGGITSFGGRIFMALFWILVIIGIIALLRYILSDRKTPTTHASALDILK